MAKYTLDKRYIFKFKAKNTAHDARTFLLYCLMGVATTVIFWGFEYAFEFLFHTKTARYVGAVIGLGIGYGIKYQLDKYFVFRFWGDGAHRSLSASIILIKKYLGYCMHFAYWKHIITQRSLIGIGQFMKLSDLPISEKLHHLRIRERNLIERTPDLASRFQDLNSFDFHRFIDAEAILYYRELQEVSPPFPNSPEMITVGGESDLRKFLLYGRRIFDSITSLFPHSAKKLSVLDFGVGCGRTSRHFFRYMDQYDVFGCDVDSAAIGYLSSEVKFVAASVSNNRPPLPYKSSKFDIIFSVSVFSHLNMESFSLWLEELSRCMRPGGTLIITLHGQHALDLLSTDGSATQINVNEKLFHREKGKFLSDGFLWLPQSVGSTDIDSSQYGISFVSKSKFEELMPSSFILKDYLEGYIGNWQDAIVLRKA